MIKHMEHTGIVVSDMERSLAFYQDILGLTLRRRAFVNDDVELAFLYFPNHPQTEVELICRPMEPSEGLVNHLAFRVDDIEAELSRLRELGVTLSDETHIVILGDVKIAFFEGPDGEKLELVER